MDCKVRYFLTVALALSLLACGKDGRELPSGGNTGTAVNPGTGDDPGQTGVTAPGNPDLSVLDLPLNEVTVLTAGHWLMNSSVMQCFAFRGDGSMFATQVAASSSNENYKLNLVHKGIDSNAYKKYMQLAYFGHGANIVYEAGPAGEDWIWVGSYGTNTNTEGSYYISLNQTVSRIRFEAGATLLPEEVEDHWYLPGINNIIPAIDFDRRQIAFWGLALDGKTGYFFVYDLDEVLALQKKKMTLAKEIVREPGTAAKSYTAEVRNLSELKAIATIRLTTASWSGGTYNFGTGGNQGIEFKGGVIYHYHGAGNTNETANRVPVTSVVTAFALDGHILGQHRVMAVADVDALEAAGITDTGFMESEGIKIYGDRLYLGYATRCSTDTRRHITILSYPLKSKDEK